MQPGAGRVPCVPHGRHPQPFANKARVTSALRLPDDRKTKTLLGRYIEATGDGRTPSAWQKRRLHGNGGGSEGNMPCTDTECPVNDGDCRVTDRSFRVTDGGSPCGPL